MDSKKEQFSSSKTDIYSLWANNLNDKDMSYSMLVDNKLNKDPLTTPLPRKIHSWVNDDAVDRCYSCKTQFSMLFRRHHCRFCGRIFCYKCSDHTQDISTDLLLSDSNRNVWHNYIEACFTSFETVRHRVCGTCDSLIDRLNAIKKWVHIFCLLDLDIREIRNLAGVCKLWWYASNYYLSIFREIQYKLPIEEYSKIEKKMLLNNVKYFGGHSLTIAVQLRLIGVFAILVSPFLVCFSHLYTFVFLTNL